MTTFSAALLLFLVMDPFGNVPLFLSVLNPIAADRRRKVIIRELLLALAALILFLFLGRYILSAVGISESILTTVGGVILFLIALRMVFPPLPVAPIQRMSMRAQMSPFLSPWPFLSLPVPLHLRQSFFS